MPAMSLDCLPKEDERLTFNVYSGAKDCEASVQALSMPSRNSSVKRQRKRCPGHCPIETHL